ncbi:MAG TPA: hypothetical protein VLD85_13935 [Anaeromyxobacteraceae bacterium]|nr:hypothetical protein [Anaeromyxobacteraceae bacterium]
MWSLEPTSALPRAAAGAAHLGAMALFVWFQELGQRLRRDEHRAWWVGTGRDLLNAAGFGGMALSLGAAGYPGAAALLAGATETLLVFGIYTYASTRTGLAHPRAWTIGAGILVCLPAILWPAEVLGLLDAVAAGLFPASPR